MTMRFLQGYALGATTAVVALSVVAFRQPQRQRFNEIDVERINIVGKDGTLRMTISDPSRLPDPVIGGKSYPLRSGSSGRAGIIFFNEEGNENGGLTYSGKATKTGHTAGAGLTFDQFNQDETINLSYDDEDGKREAGLLVSDRPEESIQVFADSAMVFKALPDGPDKTRRLQAFREAARQRGIYGSTPRLYAGKGVEKQSLVTLSDRRGRPRLRLQVDSLGAPSIQLLDSLGHMTDQLPNRRSSQRP